MYVTPRGHNELSKILMAILRLHMEIAIRIDVVSMYEQPHL